METAIPIFQNNWGQSKIKCPSLHLTFASRLRRLAPAGELKRWAAQAQSALHSAQFSQEPQL